MGCQSKALRRGHRESVYETRMGACLRGAIFKRQEATYRFVEPHTAVSVLYPLVVGTSETLPQACYFQTLQRIPIYCMHGGILRRMALIVAACK